jgi:hypothetical protein
MAGPSRGFDSPTSTQTPDAIFDYWLTRLTGGELRVLLFLVRRMYGWKKEQDDVSLSQLVNGIVDRSGNKISEGAGVSRSTAIGAVKCLVTKGLIQKSLNKDGAGADEAPTYRLTIRDRNGFAHAGPLLPVNTTQVPDAIFDYWMAHLSDSELAVLLYIVRRTLGFGKAADIISPRQFLHGIITRDGHILDEGCGVSKGKLYPALAHLTELGLITIERRVHPKKGNLPSRFALVFVGETPSAVRDRDPRFTDDPTSASGSTPLEHGEGSQRHIVQRGGPVGNHRGSRNRSKSVQSRRQGGCEYGDEGVWTVRRGYGQESDPLETAVLQETLQQESHHQQRATPPQDGVPHDSISVGGDVCNTANRMHSRPLDSATGDHRTVSGQNLGADDVIGPSSSITAQVDDRSVDGNRVRLLATEDELRNASLADDEVLLDIGGGSAQVIPLPELVRNDILATQSSYLPIDTEAYYTVEHFLGIGGDDWTAEEKLKMQQRAVLRAEYEAIYRDIGAFSLEEALAQYFTSDLVRRYASCETSDRKRVFGWLRYIHGVAGKALTNPAGFLRTRLESAQWPPGSDSCQSRSHASVG